MLIALHVIHMTKFILHRIHFLCSNLTYTKPTFIFLFVFILLQNYSPILFHHDKLSHIGNIPMWAFTQSILSILKEFSRTLKKLSCVVISHTLSTSQATNFSYLHPSIPLCIISKAYSSSLLRDLPSNS